MNIKKLLIVFEISLGTKKNINESRIKTPSKISRFVKEIVKKDVSISPIEKAITKIIKG
jgi:hypothetical protein